MRVEAEQFFLPLVLPEQLEMTFMVSSPFCPLWAFSWWAICHIYFRSASWAFVKPFERRFRSDLPAMVREIERSSKLRRYLH